MKILFQKEEFLTSLNIVIKAIKKNNLFQILDCVYIDASKSNIVLICQDGKEITIKTEAKGTIIEKGKAAIDGMLLSNIIRNMPENSEIEISVNNKKECIIKCGEKITKEFQAKDESTYPNTANINKENRIILNELKMKKILEKTIFSYDKTSDSGNMILKGIYFNVNKEDFIAKSMDGYIISVVNEKINNNKEKYETIIPGTALEEVYKLIKGEVNKDVIIYFNEKNIAFEFNNTLFISIVIPNKYIDTDRIFNVDNSTVVYINRRDFYESLIRSVPFLKESENKPVILDIKDETMVLTLNTLVGDSYEEVAVNKKGRDLTIAFNANNLIKVLGAIEDEKINLYFSGAKNPIIIKDKQETYSYLLTPVKM